jgi:hypothetical protein
MQMQPFKKSENQSGNFTGKLCYTFFMKSRYISKSPVLFVFLATLFSILCPGLLSNRLSAGEISSVIFTFDPPLINGENKSEALFLKLKNTLEAPDTGAYDNRSESLAKRIENDGATWSLSKNYSGIQLAVVYPEMTDKISQLSVEILDKINENITNLSDTNAKSGLVQKLLTVYRSNYQNPDHAPVSVKTIGSAISALPLLFSELNQLNDFYSAPNNSARSAYPVISDEQPTIVKVISWNQISANTFFTARFLGEKFVREVNIPHEPVYEIIFQPGSLKLFLIAQGDENELFKFHSGIENFCKDINLARKAPEWEIYSESAQEIMLDDSRDLMKSLLQSAWIEHWQGKAFDQVKKVDFVPAQKIESLEIMPKSELHNVSRTDSSFPRIIAARNNSEDKIVDIAIRIIAENRIVKEVVKVLEIESPLRFPISIEVDSPQSMRIQFHATSDEIIRHVSLLRARILNTLALRNLIKDLPSELSVSIAGTSHHPPFLLKGWLQQGWPADPANYSWRKASNEDIAEILDMKNATKEAIKRKWALKTMTGKGRAAILSEIISRGLFIKSFNLD